MAERGYEASNVAHIVAAAGISRHVLYGLFASRLDAFLAAQEHATRAVLEACEAAYASAGEWPERVWRVLSTLLALVQADPAFAHVLLVESYAAGPAALERTLSLQAQMELFLRDGLASGSAASRLPALSARATLGAVFALLQADALSGEFDRLPSRLPLLAYLTMAPFIGPQAAERAVQRLAAAAVR